MDCTNACIIAIHHANKSTGGYRGSTAILGAVDLMLSVTSEANKQLIEIKTEKARDIEPVFFSCLANFDALNLSFNLSPVIGKPKTQKLSDAQEYVIEFLHDNPGATIQEVASNAGICAPATARKEVYNLIKMGYVKSVNAITGGKGNKQNFTLTQMGTNYYNNNLLIP